jgi:hypothetical protein
METGDAMDPVYVTYIIPGWPKQQGEFATCGADAVEIRISAQKGSTLLEDRVVGVGASEAAPTQTTSSVWESIGILTRGDV